MKRLLLLLCVAALGTAFADMKPVLQTGDGGVFCTFDPGSLTNCRYTYVATVGHDTELRAGDFVTIYDFAGFVAGSAQADPDAFTFSSQNVGVTPEFVNAPFDKANVPNLTWTYNGENPLGPNTTVTFSAASTSFAGITQGYYTAKMTGIDPNTPIAWTQCVGTTSVPMGSGDDDNPGEVPEPMTMTLMGAGLAALGILRRRS